MLTCTAAMGIFPLTVLWLSWWSGLSNDRMTIGVCVYVCVHYLYCCAYYSPSAIG